MSATSVYRHFPDKAALMATLAGEGLARLGAAQHAAADAAGGGDAGFSATGRAYVRFALANPALFRLIFASPAPPDLLHDKRDGAPDAIAFLKANAAARVEAGTGADPDDGAVRAVALQAWSIAHGLAMLMLDGQVPADDALIDAVLGGGAKLGK